MSQFQQITSIKDERVAEARELISASGRSRLQKMQLEGEESLQWALEAGLIVEHIFYTANVRQQDLLQRLRSNDIPCYEISEGILKKISNTSYLVPLIGIAHLPFQPEKQELADDFVLVLDHIQDHILQHSEPSLIRCCNRWSREAISIRSERVNKKCSQLCLKVNVL